MQKTITTMQAVLLLDVPAAVTLLLCAIPALLHGAVVHTRPGDMDFSSEELDPQTRGFDSTRPRAMSHDQPLGSHHHRQVHSRTAEEGLLESAEDEDEGCLNCAKERQRLRLERESENDEQLLKQMRLDIIKQQILDRLGLKQRPNITRNQPRPAIPEPLLQDLDTVPAYSSEEQEDDKSKPTEVITFGTPDLDTVPAYSSKEQEDDKSKPTEVITFGTPVSTCRTSKPSGCYHFNFQENINPELIDSAELWIYKLQDPGSNQNHTLVVSELDRHFHATKRHETRLHGHQAEIQRGWVHFDMRHQVRRWVRRPSTNHGLVVTCPTCEMDPEAVPIANRDEHRVYIILRMGKPRKRTRRSTKIDCDRGQRQCCRDTLRVNFEEIGWNDWVMQPEWYDAHYCKGTCQGVQHGAHHHSTVLQHVAKFETDAQRKEELSMCCSPTKLTAISMLYLDGSGTIMKTDLNEMVVEECGCS